MTLEELQRRLFHAITKANLKHIKRLIKQGADVNAINTEGQTPLAVACYEAADDQAANIVDYFIARGADLNKFDAGGTTPLVNAVMANRPLLVQRLLENGANPNINITPHRSPYIISSALDLAYQRYLHSVIREKKGFYDDFQMLQTEILSCRCMMFLLTEAGARHRELDAVPEYS